MDGLGEVGGVVLVERLCGPVDAEALVCVGFWDDVEVHVEDGLVCGFAVVLEDVVVVGVGCFADGSAEFGECSADGGGGVI